MAITGLQIWASQKASPGVPLGSVLNLTDDDLLRDGGTAFNALPAADGTYYSNNGYSAKYTDLGDTVKFENPENWNEVKNFKIAGELSALNGQKLLITNYVHAEVDLDQNGDGTLASGNADITIDGAKRGAVETGNGNDKIDIGVTSNGEVGWSESFRFATNSGSDTVVFHGASAAGVVGSAYVHYNDGHTTYVEGNLGSGNDTFDSSSLLSNDWIDGSSGNDTLLIGGGSDSVAGGSGNDTIESNEFNNAVVGADDTIDGGAGNDRIIAGGGDDTIYGDSGNDYIETRGGNDSVDAGSGDDTVYGAGGDDTILGGSGNDQVFGGDENDWIDAGTGADYIWGSKGNDTINAGTGNDTIYGGAGNDQFLFTAPAGTDTIYDFGNGDDILDIAGLGITQAFLDSNNSGFIDDADAKAQLVGADLKLVLGGTTLWLAGVSSVDVADIHFA